MHDESIPVRTFRHILKQQKQYHNWTLQIN